MAKPEPTIESTATLQDFYLEIGNILSAKGIPALVTGGMACVAYELGTKTKDCDIIIPVAQARRVLEVVAQLNFKGAKPHYALNYGAPLDTRWLAGGWSSHTYFGIAAKTDARLDFLVSHPEWNNHTRMSSSFTCRATV